MTRHAMRTAKAVCSEKKTPVAALLSCYRAGCQHGIKGMSAFTSEPGKRCCPASDPPLGALAVC